MVKVDNKMNLNIIRNRRNTTPGVYKGWLVTKKAVFTIEWLVLIVLIVLALLAMQLYLKRSVNGRFKSAGDSFGQGRQYEPGVTIVTWN